MPQEKQDNGGSKIFRALTIAGSDSGGGAGIQADLKTFSAFGVFGMSVITSVTAQNTLGVQGVYDISPEFVGQQIESVISDIGIDAAKTGMLSNMDIIEIICQKIKKYKIKNLVIDPVMVATSGDLLLQKNAVNNLKDHLLKFGTVVTPNLKEAEVLTGINILTIEDVKSASEIIHTFGCKTVLVKGFQSSGEMIDIFFDGDRHIEYSSEIVNTKNTHGTGCTLSSAITAGLAKGKNEKEAINDAKQYLNLALKRSLNIGKGAGPLNHMVSIN